MVKTLLSSAGGAGLIPGWGARIPHAWGPKNIKQKQYCNTVNRDLKTFSLVTYSNNKKVLGVWGFRGAYETYRTLLPVAPGLQHFP